MWDLTWLAALLRRHSRAIVLGAAIVSLAARLAFGLLYWVNKPLTNDELEYLALARNLAAGRGFVYEPPAPQLGETPLQQFGRAPAYPVFLALLGMVHPLDPGPRSTPASVKISQAFVGSTGVIVIAALAARIAGPAAGAVAAIIASVYPPLVWICAYALSEALYSVLALLSVLVVGSAADRAGGRLAPTGRVFLAGLVGGIAALTRPVMLLFLGIFAGWLVTRRVRWAAVVFLVGAAAMIAPWTLRNAQQPGSVVLIAPQAGINFWIGNHALARGEGDLAANPLLKTADQELRSRHPDLDAAELEPIYYREAFTHILANPSRWLGLLGRKLFYQWIPVGPSYTLHSARYYVASLVSYGLVLPFGVAGVVLLARRRRLPAPLLLLAGSEVLAGLIFFPQERYRIPVIDPTLIICASAWLTLRVEADGARRSA